MIAEATDYLEAAQHLPQNGTLLLHNISWEEYDYILEQFKTRRHIGFHTMTGF